jgi:hypothetical protein
MIFMKGAASDQTGNHSPQKNYDLTEEASKRGDEASTSLARNLESDDSNEETNTGAVNSPDDGDVGNEIWTSSSDE